MNSIFNKELVKSANINVMNESKEELTPEEIKKKAYLMALRLKNSGLDAETIYARLEKEGIPDDMAREVVRDM